MIEDQTERLLTGLREGSVDAALIALPAEASGITEIPIYDEDFVLALPPGHPLAGKRRVPPTALAELPLLLLDEGHCLRDQALDVCRKAGVRAELANTRAASLATAVQCVTGGLGVTLIPQSAVPVETARSRLELAYFAAPRPGRRIGLVFRSSSGREGPYRQLAGLIGELLAADQQVRPVAVARPPHHRRRSERVLVSLMLDFTLENISAEDVERLRAVYEPAGRVGPGVDRRDGQNRGGRRHGRSGQGRDRLGHRTFAPKADRWQLRRALSRQR